MISINLQDCHVSHFLFNGIIWYIQYKVIITGRTLKLLEPLPTVLLSVTHLAVDRIPGAELQYELLPRQLL